MDVLILGATGKVGEEVVSHLVRAGHHVIAVSRDCPRPSSPNLTWHQADITDPADVAALPRVECAVSTLMVWDTAEVAPRLAAQGLRRLVAFSSTSAATKTQATDPGERETAARLAEGEARLLGIDGLDTTILRPTLIYGPRDLNASRIAAQLTRFPVFPLVGGGRGLRQPVDVRDLGAAAASVLACPVTEGRTYAVGGGEVLTAREMVARVGEAQGVRARFVSVPLPVARVGLRGAGWLVPRVRGVPSGALERMTKDLVFDTTAAAADFGYAPGPFSPPTYASAAASSSATRAFSASFSRWRSASRRIRAVSLFISTTRSRSGPRRYLPTRLRSRW